MLKLPKVKNWFKNKPSTRQIFTGLAMVMWAVSFIANLINPMYNPPPYVDPMIMLVGGYLFATSTTSTKENREHRESNEQKRELNGPGGQGCPTK